MTGTLTNEDILIHAEPPTKLAAALVKFQSVLSNVTKTQTADTGKYKYDFADLGDIFEEIRPHLSEAELAITQALVNGSSPGLIGIETTLWHSSGETYTRICEFPVGKEPQQVGSAITYFKRYTLSAMLGIATESDDDGKLASAQARSGQPRRQEEPPNPAQDLVDRVVKAAKAAGVSGADATNWFKAEQNEASLVKCTDRDKLTAAAEHFEGIANAKSELGGTEA